MLSILFFLICYGTSILLFLGGVQDQTKPSDLSFSAFLPCAIADVFLIIGFIFFEKKLFKIKINVPLIIILSTLFFINLITIITTPLEKTFDYSFHNTPSFALVIINDDYKVMYVFCFLLLLLNIYISFTYLLNHVHFKKQFFWLCVLIVSASLFAVIYSYIVEWETYILFFRDMSSIVKWHNPKSITNNPNNYAAILLGAVFCSYGLYAVTNKHICWIIGLFFCINIIFPMSRICIGLSILLTIMIFAYKMFVSYKEHKKRNNILIISLIAFIVLSTIICLSINEVRNYIVDAIFTHNSSLTYRLPLIEVVMSMTHGIHCVFGNGHGYFNTAFCTLVNNDVKMPHNLYIQTYGALGIVGLGALIALIIYAIYRIVILYKENREASLISLIGLVTVLIYYLVEG